MQAASSLSGPQVSNRPPTSFQRRWLAWLRHGTGAGGSGEGQKSNTLVGKSVVLEGLPQQAYFKLWSRRYKLAAGPMDERVKVLFEWGEA